MSQIEIDESLTALHDKVSEYILAEVIKVVDQKIVPVKWDLPEPTRPDQGDLDSSRKSIQVPIENQLRVPVSPHSDGNAATAKTTSRLEQVLDQ
eukprot:2595288-Amphidinium_carterae.1